MYKNYKVTEGLKIETKMEAIGPTIWRAVTCSIEIAVYTSYSVMHRYSGMDPGM
jgi:hypothetical protein